MKEQNQLEGQEAEMRYKSQMEKIKKKGRADSRDKSEKDRGTEMKPGTEKAMFAEEKSEEEMEQELETLLNQPQEQKKKRRSPLAAVKNIRNWSPKKKKCGAAVLAVAAAVLVLRALAGGKSSAPAVASMPLERGDVVSTLSLTGPISGTDSADVVSNLHAEVLEIRVKEGDRVEKGQVLAVLDRTDAQKEVDIAQNSYELAVSEYNENIRDTRNGYEKAVHCRINARNGADLIKIMTTGGVFSQGDKATPHSHFSQEEIRAAVEEAENMGSYVSTHAQATRGIKMALKNGVKCIEHGFYLDEECIELMVKNDCYLVPTLAIMHASKLYFQEKEGVLPYLKEKTEKSYEAHYRSLEMARKARITVGVGCDFLGDAAFGCPYSEATLELERLCVAGYTPMEVITMATKVNARLLQMEDQLGTLETGKLADVLLVEGRPDEDIRVLRRSDHVKLVVQDGRIVKNAMPHTAKA